MGEYAKLKTTKQDIKIGTCESMYYLRFEDRHAVEYIPGNINPTRDYDLRWRLPFPDEDGMPPGSYEDYSRGVRLFRRVELNGRETLEDFTMPEAVAFPGNLQLRHDQSGLLVNVQCFHGLQLPDVGQHARAFWNGKGHSFELVAVKNTREGVLPIVRCRHCGEMWRSSWDEVLPFVYDETLRARLAAHAKVTA